MSAWDTVLCLWRLHVVNMATSASVVLPCGRPSCRHQGAGSRGCCCSLLTGRGSLEGPPVCCIPAASTAPLHPDWPWPRRECRVLHPHPVVSRPPCRPSTALLLQSLQVLPDLWVPLLGGNPQALEMAAFALWGCILCSSSARHLTAPRCPFRAADRSASEFLRWLCNEAQHAGIPPGTPPSPSARSEQPIAVPGTVCIGLTARQGVRGLASA